MSAIEDKIAAQQAEKQQSILSAMEQKVIDGRYRRKYKPPPDAAMRIYHEYSVDGLSQRELSIKYGRGLRWIQRVVNIVERWYAYRYQAEVLPIKLAHAHRLEDIYRRCVQAFEKSGEPLKKKKVRMDLVGVFNADGSPKIDTVTGQQMKRRKAEVVGEEVIEQVPDTIHLDRARAALYDMREIFGANSPTKVAVSGTLQSEVTHNHQHAHLHVHETDKQRARLTSIAEQLGLAHVFELAPAPGAEASPVDDVGVHRPGGPEEV